jgi:hypothetical protein
MGDGQRGAGKGTLLDGFANGGEGPRELLFLIRKSATRRSELL